MIPVADSDAWSIAEGNYSGCLTMIRFRPNLKNFLGHSSYPRRLSITWEYEKKDGSKGLPSNDQLDEMREFEDVLMKFLDPDGTAILAFVFTSNGFREWNFYIADAQVVGEKINEALLDKPGLPISLEVVNDPDWSEMANVLASCKSKEEES